MLFVRGEVKKLLVFFMSILLVVAFAGVANSCPATHVTDCKDQCKKWKYGICVKWKKGASKECKKKWKQAKKCMKKCKKWDGDVCEKWKKNAPKKCMVIWSANDDGTSIKLSKIDNDN